MNVTIFCLFVLQESFSEHLGYSGGIVSGYVKLEIACVCTTHVCLVWVCLYVAYWLILPRITPSTCPALTCTAPLGSLSCWIVSCPSWGPPTTKCCSSVKWPHSWPSWRITLPTVTSSTCVWMVRHLGPRPTFGLFAICVTNPIFLFIAGLLINA